MKTPMTNGHMHVFTSECAPPNYLRVKTHKLLKKYPKPIKFVFESQYFRNIILRLDKQSSILLWGKMRFYLKRGISFFKISTMPNQRKVFEYSLKAAEQFEDNPRLIALTLDLDKMDTNSPPKIRYPAQWYEVQQIKKDYPDNIFPFISADPRTKSGKALVKWVHKYFTTGVRSKVKNKVIPFSSGIKLYPAHGHFPFDPRLDELYKYAEKNGIPLMFHCTRDGSQYIGSEIEYLIPKKPEMIMPFKAFKSRIEAEKVQAEIYTRIENYYKEGWIKNSKFGKNEHACDLFSHPQNYIPIMCKYPKLKICLAHMGGGDEVKSMHLSKQEWGKADVEDELKIIWKIDGHNWARLIKCIMKKYDNFYTDISSTITHLDEEPYATNIKNWLDETDKNNIALGHRVLFGTDFFMTEFQHDEVELYGFMLSKLGKWFDTMSRDNFDRYLSQDTF